MTSLRPPLAARRGFTLIEIMVVLVIIGVLAALIAPNVLDRAGDATRVWVNRDDKPARREPAPGRTRRGHIATAHA